MTLIQILAEGKKSVLFHLGEAAAAAAAAAAAVQEWENDNCWQRHDHSSDVTPDGGAL